MEELQNFGHEHPLVLLNEEQISNQSDEASCSRCEEKVSAQCFSCLDCDFYLHKKCAEAPLEINHPFHRDHPLVLLQNPPYSGWCVCDFCEGACKRFVYHCSCGLDFHIKCALFTYNIAEKNLKELEHFDLKDPLISADYNGKELEDFTGQCFACWEPLASYTYFSPDCGFNLHEKCANLPVEINDMWHTHPLILKFNGKPLSCKICQKTTQGSGLVYSCSPCNFVVHIDCVLAPPNVKVRSHQHAFTRLRRHTPFICDACGTEGNYAAYICCPSDIIVHKKCISLPRIIKSKYHDHHRIFHAYFLQEEDFESWDCLICHEEVNLKYGNYYCLDCNVVFHVNCAMKETNSYFIVSPEDEDDEKSSDESNDSIIVIERNDAGEATKVKHCKHSCELMLREKTVEHDKCCEGCMLPISASFYYCSHCDFFLHRACIEFPQKKHFWHHDCRQPLILTSGFGFRCEKCHCWSNGFSYKCNECEKETCLRCVIALTPGAKTCPGHKHPIFYYKEYKGQCSACGEDVSGMFRCKNKGCNFTLDHKCFSLPTTVRHKCDKDPLTLTYGDANNYSECHYCDICEEGRDPNRWFYHCTTCDTSAHINCVLGEYRFVKLGHIFEDEEIHPHPLIIVEKSFYYPDCRVCGEPCEDLAIECVESGCENYIEHYEYCI